MVMMSQLCPGCTMTLRTTMKTQHQVERSWFPNYIDRYILFWVHLKHNCLPPWPKSHSWRSHWPGKIINHPNGTDVYHGVPKDYVCGSVRPDLFLQVSQYYNLVKMTIMDGRMWQRFDFNVGCRCWKEKRSMVYLELAKLSIQVTSSSSSWLLVLMILSIAGPKDNVFVYFADHGAKVKDYHVYPSTFITIKMKHDHHLQGLVAFGQDVLKATALNQAIKDMHAAKKYFLSSGW